MSQPAGPRRPKLLDQVRAAIRGRHYSRRTERAYVSWIRRFIIARGTRHPAGMGATEITAFLTTLAVDRHVAPSTQNQALSAILFLYREVLALELPWLEDVVRAKAPHHVPVVLSRAEVSAVLGRMTGVPALMAGLLYGSGLRLLECCRLRVQDVDFGRHEISRACGQGCARSPHDAPGTERNHPRPPPRPRASTTQARSRIRGRVGRASACAREEVSQRRTRMALAVAFSGNPPLP